VEEETAAIDSRYGLARRRNSARNRAFVIPPPVSELSPRLISDRDLSFNGERSFRPRAILTLLLIARCSGRAFRNAISPRKKTLFARYLGQPLPSGPPPPRRPLVAKSKRENADAPLASIEIDYWIRRYYIVVAYFDIRTILMARGKSIRWITSFTRATSSLPNFARITIFVISIFPYYSRCGAQQPPHSHHRKMQNPADSAGLANVSNAREGNEPGS